MRKQERKINSKLSNMVKMHIYNNLKQYTIISILFFIGILIGVIFVNQQTIEAKQEMENSFISVIESLKNGYEVDFNSLLRSVVIENVLIAFFIWFMGCMVIGIYVVYGIVVFRGFTLGYTISSILFTFGIGKGVLFCFLTLFLQNVIIIPSIFALSVSGAKLYQSIMKNKKRENIKIEIVRHTIFSLFVLIFLLIASLVEVYGSNFLLSVCINWF